MRKLAHLTLTLFTLLAVGAADAGKKEDSPKSTVSKSLDKHKKGSSETVSGLES